MSIEIQNKDKVLTDNPLHTKEVINVTTLVPVNNNNNNIDDGDKEETFFRSNFKDYFYFRLRRSNLCKYYYGSDLSINESDEVVNTFSLVNALILTIPFGIIGSLDNSFWDWLHENNTDCAGNSYGDVHKLFINFLYATAYSSMISLSLAIFYYILRPKNQKYFNNWWKRAKYVILVMLGTTATSIISMLVNFGTLCGWYTSRSSDLCETQRNNVGSYRGAVAVMVITIIIGICLML